jgi:hypothetical protein
MGELLTSTILTVGLATLVSQYDGAFDLFLRLRTSRLGKLFDCNVCLVPYIALIPVLWLHMGFMDYLVIVGAGVILSRHV